MTFHLLCRAAVLVALAGCLAAPAAPGQRLGNLLDKARRTSQTIRQNLPARAAESPATAAPAGLARTPWKRKKR